MKSTVLSYLPIPSVLIDKKKLKIVEANNCAAEFTGMMKTELIGKHISYFIDIGHINFEQISEYQSQEHRNISFSYGINKGILVHQTIQEFPYRNEDYYLLTFRRESFKEIIEEARIGFIEDDIEGRIIYFNKHFSDMFGYSPDELKQHSHNTLVHPDDREFVGKFHQMRLQNKVVPSKYEFRGVKKNGEIFYIEISVKTILEKNGSYYGTQSYLWDVTNRKELEIQLRDAKEKAEESDRLKSAFLANISHEIRTPLNGILGFTSLLGDTTITDEQREKYRKIISESGNRLLSVINDVMDISKIEAGEVNVYRDQLNIDSLLQEMEDFYRSKAREGVHIRYQAPANNADIHIYTDKTKIYQIVNNLIGNAIKFTHKGTICYGYSVNNNYLKIFVKDTGIGIPEKFKDKIFERFIQVGQSHSRDYEGTGLGLSISKKLVELLNGRIYFESKLNTGTTFFVEIPLNYS